MTLLKNVLDTDRLSNLISGGFVSVREHPTLPLVIYNYTQKAQFENSWGDGVIDYCRGLIVDKQGNIVARPFKKFHNLNTGYLPETHLKNLPRSSPIITEKMDGSLGILWRYGNDWGVATRGSFTSPQALWATNWYKTQIDAGVLQLFGTHRLTPLFEIVYPENRIVCKYDFEGLVLLGFVDIETGSEKDQQYAQDLGEFRGFKPPYIVKNHTKSFKQILSDNEKNREGYVLTYLNEDAPPLKLKIKFEDYVRLHKIITGVSPKAIWQILAEGEEIGWVEDTPEHFRDWAQKWVDRLYQEFNEIYETAKVIYIDRPIKYPGLSDAKYRGECAVFFKKETDEIHNEKLLSVLFCMLDGKDGRQLDERIWNLIEPRGDDQSFKKEEG